MTRYVFEQVRFPATKTVKCARCGKSVRRSTTFGATVNPWNRNEAGEERTRSEIVEVLRQKAKAWMSEPVTHTKCAPSEVPE